MLGGLPRDKSQGLPATAQCPLQAELNGTGCRGGVGQREVILSQGAVGIKHPDSSPLAL